MLSSSGERFRLSPLYTSAPMSLQAITRAQGRCAHLHTTSSGSNVHQVREVCLACGTCLGLFYPEKTPDVLVEQVLVHTKEKRPSLWEKHMPEQPVVPAEARFGKEKKDYGTTLH